MSELKKCPFCGCTKINLKRETYDSSTVKTVYYLCNQCEAQSEYVDVEDEICLPDSVLETQEKWNTRPLEDALTARIAELEEAGRKLIKDWESRGEGETIDIDQYLAWDILKEMLK